MAKLYSFYSGIFADNALEFSKRSSYVREIMLERIYPRRILVPLRQGLGAEAIPVVKEGDHVLIGSCIAVVPSGVIGAPVHSGISGTVKSIRKITLPNGIVTAAVEIISDNKRTFHESIKPRQNLDINAKTVMGIIKNSGIIGMGGEGIPVIAKISRAKKYQVKELLVNCLQSEPYATSDLYKINEASDYVVQGALAVAGSIGVKKIRFLISKNRKAEQEILNAAIERCKKTFNIDMEYEVALFKERYPQGYYRLIARALYAVELKENEILENTVHAVLFNCSTMAACWDTIKDGLPMFQRVITVAGDNGVLHNVLAPIGTPISEIVKSEFGAYDSTNRILWGNALTGIPVNDYEHTPVIKTTSALTIIRKLDYATAPCLHCGLCSDACAMDISVDVAYKLIERNLTEAALNENVLSCISCGLCSYVCPSGLDLASTISDFTSEYKIKMNKTGAMFSATTNSSEDTSVKHFSDEWNTLMKDIDSCTLLEDFNEKKEEDSEDEDYIVLPFEGGKKI